VIKQLLCAVVFLVGSSALRAGTFDFSFAGTGGVSASGVLTTTGSGGIYTITGITGTQNGYTISDGSGILTEAGSSFAVILDFDLPGSQAESVTGAVGTGAEVGSKTAILTSFSISSVSGVPESATLLLLLTMGLGVWVLVRKLPSQNTP
jgi:hypothetical protein